MAKVYVAISGYGGDCDVHAVFSSEAAAQRCADAHYGMRNAEVLAFELDAQPEEPPPPPPLPRAWKVFVKRDGAYWAEHNWRELPVQLLCPEIGAGWYAFGAVLAPDGAAAAAEVLAEAAKLEAVSTNQPPTEAP